MAGNSCINFEAFNIEELCDTLKTNHFDADVVEVFRTNKIDGITFLELNSSDLKELGIIALGDRKKTERLKSMSTVPTERRTGSTAKTVRE